MANPKYIDETLLPEPTDESNKNVTKKAYSFRCDETLLNDMTTYAEKEGIKMPQLLSNIMNDFLHDKTLTNTYLPEYEGQYISIPSNVNEDAYEYELRYVMNNLDVWDSKYGYVSIHAANNKFKSLVSDNVKFKPLSKSEDIIHEGIDFLIIPETVHTGNVPEDIVMGGLRHTVDLKRIPSCLYCMYITVSRNGSVRYEVISWIDAMNKLKAVERYDLISYANTIKKKLNELHDMFIIDITRYDEEAVDYNTYGRLLKIANDFNTGAILPASNSIDNIEYAAIVEKLPDYYDLINKLMKENNELKGIADELTAIKKVMDKVDNLSDDELLEIFKKRER